MFVRILHLTVLAISDPGLRIVLVEVLAGNKRAIDGLAILLLDGLAGVKNGGKNDLDGVAALHVWMVVVLLYNLQQVNHIPGAGNLFPSHLIIGDTVDEIHQLLLVRLVTILQLLADIAKDGVLMGGITEDGAIITLQLTLEFAQELEVGEFVLLRIEELTHVLDRTVGLDDVV